MKKMGIAACTVALVAVLFAVGMRMDFLPAMNPGVGARPPCVLLDAGHGGVDGGAVARDGTPEKGINLAIMLDIKSMLQLFGFQVITTRETDVSIHDAGAKTIRQQKASDLNNRLKLLHASDADFLVSIHQNSYPQSKYRGTQVFYGGKNAQSKVLAGCVQQRVKAILQSENNREVKQSTKDIFLLYYAEKPAVLVECGFMTNAAELELLKTEDYQRQMSAAVVAGVLAYLASGD